MGSLPVTVMAEQSWLAENKFNFLTTKVIWVVRIQKTKLKHLCSLFSRFNSLPSFPILQPHALPWFPQGATQSCFSSSPSSSSNLSTPWLCFTLPSLLPCGFPCLGCALWMCPQLHSMEPAQLCPQPLPTALPRFGLPSPTLKPLSGFWVFLESIFMEKVRRVVPSCWVSSVMCPGGNLVSGHPENVHVRIFISIFTFGTAQRLL